MATYWLRLAQVMASCLTASSHYLDQCWLSISKVKSSLIHLRAYIVEVVSKHMPPTSERRCKIFSHWLSADLTHCHFGVFHLSSLVIFKSILVIDGWGISCENALKWIKLDLTVLMLSQYWFRQCLDAVRQEAITWANFNPYVSIWRS